MISRTSRATGAFLFGALVLLGLGVPAWCPEAHAYDFVVSARSEGYGYQLRRLSRDRVEFLNRRRFTQYLGLRLFNLLDPGDRLFSPASRKPPRTLTLNLLMRFDTDFGGYVDHGGAANELENNRFDLLFGAIEGRNLSTRFDFTLGRQYDTELLDIFAFDGLRLRVNLPFFLGGLRWQGYVEALFGVQVARAHPLSGSEFETDGTSDDGTDDAWSPVFGVAAGLDGSRWLNLRLAYRGVASRSDGVGGLYPTVWGVDQEALFASIGGEIPWLGTRPQFGLRYNLLLAQIDDIQAQLLQRIGRRQQLELEFLRSRPHFDGDSIFNLFDVQPYNELSGRYRLRLWDALGLNLRLGYRRFWTDDGGAAEPDALTGAVGARLRLDRVQAGAEVFVMTGHGGTSVGGDLDGSWQLIRRLRIEGRATVIQLDSNALVASNGVNLGLQLGGRLTLFRGVNLHLIVEDNISSQYRSSLKVFGIFDLEVAP